VLAIVTGNTARSYSFYAESGGKFHRHAAIPVGDVKTAGWVERQRNRVTRAPEPTTIEFQAIFREIISEVSAANRRLLFVVDNLDRLPEADAVAMWGTIRSFFLGARNPTKLPTVILPIDEQAVERMYAASHADEQAETLAKSFMDKTFDLTFRVTTPVMSDWQKYLGHQLAEVFGEHLPTDAAYIVSTLYQKYLDGIGDGSVTPRIVNALVNEIGVYWLQWECERVSFASVAYYIIYRKSIDADIQRAVSEPQGNIRDFDPDWSVAIASVTTISYGAYGEPQSWSGSRFSYTGQIMLQEISLYHYKARAYDPGTGRFLQTDPVGYKDDVDLYAYVGVDPVNKSDPSGNDSCGLFACNDGQGIEGGMNHDFQNSSNIDQTANSMQIAEADTRPAKQNATQQQDVDAAGKASQAVDIITTGGEIAKKASLGKSVWGFLKGVDGFGEVLNGVAVTGQGVIDVAHGAKISTAIAAAVASYATTETYKGVFGAGYAGVGALGGAAVGTTIEPGGGTAVGATLGGGGGWLAGNVRGGVVEEEQGAGKAAHDAIIRAAQQPYVYH